MEIYFKPSPWQKQRSEDMRKSLSLGFVPTMGALHDGHLSLIKRSMAENDRTLVSIFVNSPQFDNEKDLSLYPQDIETDIEILRRAGVHYLFLPDFETMYPDKFRFQLTEIEVSKWLCGAHRSGHFDGVLTIVLKLFLLAQANRAYFGEKDYQQLRLITDMAKALLFELEVIACPIIREEDGLAMSSRNQNLSAEDRLLAPKFYQILQSAPDIESAIKLLTESGFSVDYVEEKWGRRLGAIRINEVRLIDNVKLL